MSTMAASFIRADDWNADVHGTVSAAYRISADVRQKRNLLMAWAAFQRLNSAMEGFFGGFNELIRDAQAGKSKSNDGEGMTPAEWHTAVKQLWDMHAALDYLYQLSVRRGLRKKALLTRQMKRLEDNRERTVDIIQWIQFSMDQSEMEMADMMFDAALEELKLGETVAVG